MYFKQNMFEERERTTNRERKRDRENKGENRTSMVKPAFSQLPWFASKSQLIPRQTVMILQLPESANSTSIIHPVQAHALTLCLHCGLTGSTHTHTGTHTHANTHISIYLLYHTLASFFLHSTPAIFQSFAIHTHTVLFTSSERSTMSWP